MFENNNLNTAFTTFLLMLLVLNLYNNTNSLRNLRSSKKYIVFLFCFVLMCVFAFYNDFWSLQKTIPLLEHDERYGAGLEGVYIWIARLCNYNYYLWRFVCWGFGVVFISLLLKRLYINNNYSVLVICCCYYWLFGYARSAIAMTLFTLGYSYCSGLYKFKFSSNIPIGAFIMLLSFYAHKSQMICLLAIPALFVNMDRRVFLISLLCLPLAISGINYGFEHMDMIFSAKSSYYDMDILSSKAERYLTYDKTQELGGMRIIMGSINEFSLYLLEAFLVYTMSIKNGLNKVNIDTKSIYGLMYVLLYFAIAAAFGGYEQSVYSYRIFNMSVYPAVICLLLLYRDNLVKAKTVTLLAFICFGCRVLESFIYELYVVLS